MQLGVFVKSVNNFCVFNLLFGRKMGSLVECLDDFVHNDYTSFRARRSSWQETIDSECIRSEVGSL